MLGAILFVIFVFGFCFSYFIYCFIGTAYRLVFLLGSLALLLALTAFLLGTTTHRLAGSDVTGSVAFLLGLPFWLGCAITAFFGGGARADGASKPLTGDAAVQRTSDRPPDLRP